MGITISDLSVAYGSEKVISNLSLNIPAGHFFSLLGPSGCGKTTLLRTIAGFIGSVGGNILFQDHDVTRLPPHKRNIGMVFQDYALFPDKTVADNVAYGLKARGQRGSNVKQQVVAALERVGLEYLIDRYPAALSGGQRQRVALARALVIKPQVLLMDEPLSNLDAKLRIQIRETITEIQKELNITTIFVTHDQEEALSMSDLIGVMNKGHVEQLGTPQQIYATPKTGYVADFVGAANRLNAKITSVQNDMATIMVADQALQVTKAYEGNLTEGLLILRPEDFKILKEKTDNTQSLPAKIKNKQYLGSKTSYRLILENKEEVFSDVHGVGHDAFAVGDLVQLGISSHLARVIRI